MAEAFEISSPLAALGVMAALSRMAGDGKADNRSARPAEQDVAALMAAADRYLSPVAFEPRQLVTPRADSMLKDAGKPHVVLEIGAPGSNRFVQSSPKDVGSPNFGARLDMRVASTCSCDHGEILAHWVESWMFEPWTPSVRADVSESAATVQDAG